MVFQFFSSFLQNGRGERNDIRRDGLRVGRWMITDKDESSSPRSGYSNATKF